ncbi:uncharacterized protein LOC124124840 isoform X3 [Haliotis rufescens]|uniref:uncharacterized protein LOC124124840 isoform X3 n=1 Tax=Haliotis rufescens TaxID=6454 RepID=UPI00201E7537|nr:uncharacterized protein LOC124124840 isoform X3 [Haliotis rufescens]
MFLFLVMVMYAVKLGVHAQNTTQPAGFADDTRGASTVAAEAATQPAAFADDTRSASTVAAEAATQPTEFTDDTRSASTVAAETATQPAAFADDTRSASTVAAVAAAKPAALKVAATFLVVCDKCDYDKGYGYVRDPEDCNTYYQCVRDKGVYYTFHCPPGLVWDAQALACNWPYLVSSCSDPPDPCTFMAPDPSNPYGYKKLVSGTWLVKVCPLGEMYDPTTCTCVPDPCYNREYHPSNPNAYKQYVNGKWVVKWCAFWQVYNRDTCTCVADPCHQKKAHPANTHVYLEYENSKWIVRPCAPGTAYNETSCNCDIHSRVPFFPACKPVLYLPLYYNTEDAAHDHHVDNHGVYIHYDIPAAVWDGSSSLSVPYFRNGYYGDELTISFYYFRIDNVTRVVVSNSLCDGVEATVYIIVVPDGVCFHVKNNYGDTFVMCVPCPGAIGWSFAMLKIHDGKMIGVTGTDYRVRDFYGTIPPTKCPLSIGKGLHHLSFYGKIVQFVVYVGCNPHQYKRASDLLKQGSVNAALIGTTSPLPVLA